MPQFIKHKDDAGTSIVTGKNDAQERTRGGGKHKNEGCALPFKSYDFIYHNYCVYSNKTDIYWMKMALNQY